MLDNFSIFTKGGLVLWTFQVTALRGSPIDSLIKTCLLEEKSGESWFQYGHDSVAYTLKWTLHNDLGLVFVAVYQRILQLLYVDELLGLVSKEFLSFYSENTFRYDEFNPVFQRLVELAECNLKKGKGPTPFMNGTQAKKDGVIKRGGGSDRRGMDSSNEDDHETLGNSQMLVSVSEDEEAQSKAVLAFDMQRLRRRKGSVKGVTGGRSSIAKSDSAKPDSDLLDASRKNASVSGEKKKQMRKWQDSPTDERLDYTDEISGEKRRDSLVLTTEVTGRSLMDADEEECPSEDGEERGVQFDSAGEEGRKKGWLSSIFESVAGKGVLESDDLVPALNALKERLLTKNVAEEIAEKLCKSVAANLVGRKQMSFSRVSSIVKIAMEEALVRILTPRRSIDVLRDVQGASEEGRPYVIVFVGVNGVGKSTNLAKVAYWLLQHDVKVMLAACDTFRSGAVEQLRTHGRRLQIPVFERGYEKDPAAVAKEAIREATRTKQDVVLVDTAGRMQDNEPLMRALTKLISINQPDLVLFVGEALVGNDAVDQLSKFNQRLTDLASSNPPHTIDGVLLTKFDTIDDKVGAALSMVYTSGAPIMFIGCGQTYLDLKKLDVKIIAKTLLQ